MALEALECPNCKGDVELDKDQEFGFCKYCGTKVQNTSIKMVKGKVKIDKKKDLENQFGVFTMVEDNLRFAPSYKDTIEKIVFKEKKLPDFIAEVEKVLIKE